METLRPFLIMAIILGFVIMSVQTYFAIINWQEGVPLDIAGYQSPLPATLVDQELFDELDERRENMPVEDL